MTYKTLKELCDNINVSLNNNLMYYHKEIIGRFYFIGSKFVCDILVIGSALTNSDDKVSFIEKCKKLHNLSKYKVISMFPLDGEKCVEEVNLPIL